MFTSIFTYIERAESYYTLNSKHHSNQSIEMVLSVWLVFFLKEMLLEAMKLNMNKPYFCVEIEEFILYIEIELLANAVNIDPKCRVFIKEIMDILRKMN